MRPPRPLVVYAVWLALLACRKDTPVPPNAREADVAADSSEGTPATDSVARSAARFTQAFYDWYAQRGWRLDSALSTGRAFFSPQLYQALTADFEAQARNPDEIVGLDGDPFLDAQDVCAPYRVHRIARRADTVLVAVHGECSDAAPRADPDAIAELLRRDSTWVFVNFRYLDPSGDLLSELAELRRARSGEPRAARH